MPPWKKSHKSKLKRQLGLKRQTLRDEPARIFMSRQASLTDNRQNLNEQECQKMVVLPNEKSLNNLSAKANAQNLTTSLTLQKIKLHVIIVDQNREQRYSIKEQEVLINEEGEIVIADLISYLKRTGHNMFDKALISIFNKQETQEQNECIPNQNELPVYTYCGQDPLSEHFRVKIDLSGPFLLKLEIKIRSTKSTLVDQLLNEQNIESDKISIDKFPRVKERKVSEVIQKVALWRRFYSGFYNENREFVQTPLNEAANQVNISKKTLDDYLLQIRCGKRYGFDFNNNQNERIGKLRTFVKDRKLCKREVVKL